LFAIAAAMMPAAARAGTDRWASATSGYFDVNSNWQDGSAPNSLDEVVFDVNTTPYQVWWDSITGNRTTQSMSLTDGNVTFRISTGTYAWTITDPCNEADANITGGGAHPRPGGEPGNTDARRRR
jgi:hypothetical protein